MNQKKTNFGLGLLIGALGGALAGILYAPKKGEQTRKDVSKRLDKLKEMFSEGEIEKKTQEIFGKVTDETKELYLTTTKELLEKIADLRTKVDEIDRSKYQKLVNDVVSNFRKSTKESSQTAQKLKNYLQSDWKAFVEGKPSKSRKAKTSKRKK